ncbi:MAG TPA: adenylate/guanylate cyclase domain-containing protein [Burkholderiales bacterium]|nr:adenylate/guanylate cyclase domain-containing protein [Burkholderiales bacterium]
MQRRLGAFLSADVAGYSRLMGEDEVATVRTLAEYRAFISSSVADHRGRIVDMPGDNVLAEFGSAVDAVQAAADIQAELARRNGRLPENRRMQFRMGINLGDVIVEDGRLYGDGVNVAARLEALAEGGGVCVSAKVHDEVRRKLDLVFEDAGEVELKNIATPVRCYRLRLGTGAAREGAAAPAQQVKPSIIVLPFTNMSGDPEQEFFVDGLTEDILTELSRFRELFVISRNTAFKLKGQAVDVKKVAREVGVQYVVEGSVRKAGSRVRITVQLIDGESDHHVWAERYDRQLEDIFDIQDEVTRAIVATLPGRVEAAARDRAERKQTHNMAAYECLLAAKVRHHRSQRDENAAALQLAERAIELDPKYGHAHAWKACILGQQWGYGWCADRKATEDVIVRELDAALALDDNDSDVHRIYAAVHIVQNQHDKAIYHQERALSLNPNDDLIVVQHGELLTWLGKPEEGIEWIRKAMRLNPFHPDRFWSHLGRAQFAAHRYDEAIQSVRHISPLDVMHHLMLAACYAKLGDAATAAQHMSEARKRDPALDLEAVMATAHYQNEADLIHCRDCMIAAGLTT